MDSTAKKIATDASNMVDNTTAEERSQALATALFDIGRDNTFFGSVFQSMEIMYSLAVPTAGVSFSADQKKYILYINPMYFIRCLSQDERKAVLMHELLHLVHRHLTRVPFFKMSRHNMSLMNIAADLSINTFIKGLPNGCKQCPTLEEEEAGAKCNNNMCPGRAMLPKNFTDVDANGRKIPWPSDETMEQYFFRLKERYSDENDGEGDGDGDESNDPSDGTNNGGKSGKKVPSTLDEHAWEANSDEKEMLDSLEELVKRAMIKSSTDIGGLPSVISKLLEEIKSRREELNYKKLILSAIKKSASGNDRKYTWARKNKRFPNLTPGNKEGPLPKLRIIVDTSGSISIETMNSFLSIVDEFLKVGSRKCSLHLFSDDEYHSQIYKMGNRVGKEQVRNSTKMGGTCVEGSLKNILKNSPDLSIVLTDGHFCDVSVESWLKHGQKFPEVLWVIEKDGTDQHPFASRSWSKTVKIPKK